MAQLRTFATLSLVSVVLGDILGPTYPAPIDLSSSNSVVPQVWSNVSNALDAVLNGTAGELAASFPGIENVTFSIGAFSLNDPAAFDKLQYHYTSAEVRNGNGTHQVDADSIYQLASITKVVTALTGLLTLTQEQWDTPLIECIPGLSQFVQNSDSTLTTQWSTITPWDLANQEGGVAEQAPLQDAYVLSLQELLPPWSELGFPPATEFETQTPCIDDTCTGAQYGTSAGWYDPTVLPWSTPLYANNGYILLGIALANLTGKTIPELYQEAVLGPLSMSSTTAGAPTSEAARARAASARDISYYLGAPVFYSSGGVYSSLRDLAAFGNGILNSTLLTPKQTRKWLKPISHTANFNYSVGAPGKSSAGHILGPAKWSIYTRSLSGDADTHFVLIPDYNAGFTYLSVASNATTRGLLTGSILDAVSSSILPALEQQATTEAIANFAGTYKSSELNSSVVISFNESTAVGAVPALSMSEWIYNRTDLLSVTNTDIPRLVQTIANQGNGRVAFTALDGASVPAGLFTGTLATNGDWIVLDAQRYGGSGLVFVFDVDGEGRATAVSPLISRDTLKREAVA